MKKILILFLILIIILLQIYHNYKRPLENLATDKLRDLAHLPATVYRASNTILTSAAVFSDAMDKLTLPNSIKDNYNEWIEKGFISPIKDQMLCGGCWAFATCGSLADRLTIATNGQWQPPFGLSEQILISCGGDMGMDFYQGCEGGIPHFAIDALSKMGVPADSKCDECSGTPATNQGRGGSGRSGVVNPNDTNTCLTGGNIYSFTNYTWWQTGCDSSTSCNLSAASTCPCAEISTQMKLVEDVTNTPFDVKYKTIGEAHNYTSHGENDELHTVDLWPDIPQLVIDKNVDRMKKAIYYEGPITVGYRVTADFYTYWPTASVDNYYKYDGRSQMQGGHAVVIVGWRKMADGTPVWIIKNSWGANGGYGFPDGAKWNNPITGENEPKYIGGFWNHIMGINDSFIEANASGAHPNLQVPQIAQFLPANIPANWYDTMTLRDIYKGTVEKPPVTPLPPQPPAPVTPTPVTPDIPDELGPVEITSDVFFVVTLTVVNVSPKAIIEFFELSNSLFMVGSDSAEAVRAMLGLFPTSKARLSQLEVEELADKMKENIQDYIIVAVKGTANSYYHIDGDPREWSIFRNYAHRAATAKKLANDTFGKFQSPQTQSPIIQASQR